MSRNVNKANSVLVRFQEIQAAKEGGYQDFSRLRRPANVNKVTKVDEALKWRNELVREIGQKITQIHDPSLNEDQIMDLNDELNNLFKEKIRWEWHIKNKLKGPDLRKRNQLNTSGGTIVDGKRYFGRALELGEVKKLLSEEQKRRDKEKTGKEKKRELAEKKRVWQKTLGESYFIGNMNEDFLEYESTLSRKLQNEVPKSDKKPSIILPSFTIPTMDEAEKWLVEKRRKELRNQLGL